MDDLTLIKKHYGEKMSHLCRELFPTILETNGLLFDLLLKQFNPSKFLYDDIIEENKVSKFKNFIYSLIDKKEANRQKINKTPFELLDEAGYILYECKTENDIENFRKYFKKNEELCTFNYGNRLDSCYVFFAVKKNVDKIKREDFKEPKRQDEYGTSVISIQFSRDNKNTLSIKNRYNHTVSNPDATFSNNLDNIIPGLTESFNEYYNFNINSDDSIDFELNNYVIANDGKHYRYNYEINNIYYCPDNIIIDNFNVYTEYSDNKERYIVLDYFLLDLKDKEIYILDNLIDDCFPYIISNINKIKVEKIDDKRIIEITEFDNNHIKIVLDKYNRIIEYYNDLIKTIYNNFLLFNETLTAIKLPEVREIGNSFLLRNDEDIKIDFPNLLEIGDSFFRYNDQISEIKLPQVKKIGDSFFRCNDQISEIKLPQVKKIRDCFLMYNHQISKIKLPQVKKIGTNFMPNNKRIAELLCPNLVEIGDDFLVHNLELKRLEFPKVEIIGDSFMFNNKLLNSVYMPNVIEIGDFFIYKNNSMYYLHLPKVSIIGEAFMYSNRIIRSLKMPKVKKIGEDFLYHNIYLEKIDISDVETISFDFLPYNECLKSINLPNVERISFNFLSSNKVLSSFNAPCLKEKEESCFYDNPTMQEKVDEIISNNQKSVTKTKKLLKS